MIFYCKSIKNLMDEIINIVRIKINEKIWIKKNEVFDLIHKNNIKRKRNKTSEIAEKEIKSSIREIIESQSIIISKKNIEYKKKEKIFQTDEKKYNSHSNNLEYTESLLNSLSYKKALQYDKRSYIQYYFSLIKKKQPIFFSFYPNKDYNSQIIKSFLFFFFYASDISINALFFTDNTMHKIYVDSGSFNLSYQIPQIIYSSLIAGIINIIIEYLSLSENIFISIISEKDINSNKSKKVIREIKTKFYLYFIVTFILLFAFWYYISCFSCIYENTQMHLIKDSLMSFVISLIYPVIINLMPVIFRIRSLSSKKGNKLCMYKLSQFIEFIL